MILHTIFSCGTTKRKAKGIYRKGHVKIVYLYKRFLYYVTAQQRKQTKMRLNYK